MVENVPFAAFCRVLTNVAKASKSDTKLNLVFSDKLRQSMGATSSSIYPFLRLLLPHLDRERTYKLKEKTIAKMYVEILGLSDKSSDGKKLLNWTDPTIVTTAAVGDFPQVLELVMKSRSTQKDSIWTLGDVNAILDALTKASSPDEKKTILLRFIKECSAMEQKWLMRIVIKDMKIGLKHDRVLKFIHPDAVEMFNHTNDLERVRQRFVCAATSISNRIHRIVLGLQTYDIS
jgi:DNA ligase-4